MVTDKAPLLKEIMAADLTKVAITLGAGVDPDGLASQLAMAYVIKSVKNGDSDVSLFYKGDFDHPQNATMQQLLSLNPMPEEKFNPEDGYTTCISMDGPPSVCPFTPDFVIDHHEQSGDTVANSDVRMIGSCSAIAWEYAMEAGFDWETEEGIKLATALAIGIQTDTRNGAVESCHPLDYEALAHCQIHKDDKLYRDILNYPKPPYYMDALAKGWAEGVRDPDTRTMVGSVGVITPKRIWLIPTLAEQYASMAGVETSVVFGIVNGNIKISVRSSNSALKVNDFMKRAFDSGGGKRGAGAATIKMPSLLRVDDDEHGEQALAFYRDMIINRAIQVAGDGIRRKKTES